MDLLQNQPPAELKLYMLLLGCKPAGRHVEQHDFFFGIAAALKDLVPEIKAFWPGTIIHIDAWREVKTVEGYKIDIVPNNDSVIPATDKLFFINLGGYQPNQFEEQHYTLLTVKPNMASAIKEAKKTVFYKTSSVQEMKSATSHVDDKYGIDVDDIYEIKDLLNASQKSKYHIQLTPAPDLPEDEIQLGYFRLDKL